MRILITAGSTWVKIDDVRILTNRFTGKTGAYLWQKLKERGYAVTLLVNPHCLGDIKEKSVVAYNYFDEFKEKLIKLLHSTHYDVIIHMAAVSDYTIKNIKKGKIPSGYKNLKLDLAPTEKIIKKIRDLAKKSLLIQFKLEVHRRGLINEAYRSLLENKSNFVIANALKDLKKGYKGFLIDRDRNVVPINSRSGLLKILGHLISASQF